MKTLTEHRLGFAVIGCGKMGKRRIQTIIRHPNAELICVADNDELNAKNLAKEARCAYYTDFKGGSEAQIENNQEE